MTSIRSIFGEWSGNVRSTPTPKDCLRTVKVSRAPAPWRFRTMPSKTWIRCLWPSITLKCTRTVSPALNRGMSSRNWARSSVSITLLIGRRPSRPPRNASASLSGSVERDAARRPVRGEDRADQIFARHEAPPPRVAGGTAVVAHHQVVALGDASHRAARRDVGEAQRLAVSAVGPDVGLIQLPAVDVDEAFPLRPDVAGQSDQPLDEGPFRPALLPCQLGRLEDHDLAPLGIAEVVDEPVRQHAVGGARLAALGRTRAVEGRLHRRGRDSIGIHDPCLDRQDDRDRAGDRDHPVDPDAPPVREVREEAVDRVAGLRLRLTWRSRPVALHVVAGALLGITKDLIGVTQLAPGAVLVPALERGAPVGSLELLGGSVRTHAEDGVMVAHKRLRPRLCSRRHASIFPWSPDRSTSGTRQPRNSGGRV